MRYFITSSGTDIGKTFITTALVQQARALQKNIAAYKPIITGFDPFRADESDTGLILKSLGQPLGLENLEHVSPWRYKEPIAPSMAARLENNRLDFQPLLAHSRKAMAGPEDIVLIEGVGGIMVPLNDRRTVLDWVEALGIPVLLVIGTYLGSISHTLTALTVLRQRQIPIRALIINESEHSVANTMDEMRIWTDAPLFFVKRRSTKNSSQVDELRPLMQSA